MRFLSVILFLFSLAVAQAHELSGTVEILLKGDKKKSDLSSVIVYLDQASDELKIPEASLKKKFEMATKNKQFSPRALVIPMGAAVDFPNYDPIFHNLFSVSRPNDFDLGLYKGGASKSKTFEAPGIVRVFCNVHPQMTATIVVASSLFYAFADKSGNFSLGNIPWGTFSVRAYAEEGQVAQKIEMKDTPIQVKLTIDGHSFKKLKHKNKFGKDYSTDENENY